MTYAQRYQYPFPTWGQRDCDDAKTEAMGRPCSEVMSFGEAAMPEAIHSWFCQVNEPVILLFYLYFKLVSVAF